MLVFALFLLFFVVLLVVGESMVLLARFREERGLLVEADSRLVVDRAVGHVNDLAAAHYDKDPAEPVSPACDTSAPAHHNVEWRRAAEADAAGWDHDAG